MKLLFSLFVLLVSQIALAHEYADRIILKDKPTAKFIIADKELGKVFVIDPVNKTEVSSPALYGKLATDKVDITYYDRKEPGAPYITPAGIYKVTLMFSDTLNRDMLVFYEGTYMVMAIHPVWLGNSVQKRLDRLASDDPKLHRITNGCINVSQEFFDEHLSKLDNAVLYILPELETSKVIWEKEYPKLGQQKLAEVTP